MKHPAAVAVLLTAFLLAACDQTEKTTDETTQEPAAEEPAEQPGETVVEEEVDVIEETIVVPPTVSEDAPTEPHMGEPPSPSQPQPVYPDGEPGAAEPDDAAQTDEPAGEMVVEEEMEAVEETIVGPPTDSEDAPAEPHMGEPPSPSQPQPVYPDGAPEGL